MPEVLLTVLYCRCSFWPWVCPAAANKGKLLTIQVSWSALEFQELYPGRFLSIVLSVVSTHTFWVLTLSCIIVFRPVVCKPVYLLFFSIFLLFSSYYSIFLNISYFPRLFWLITIYLSVSTPSRRTCKIKFTYNYYLWLTDWWLMYTSSSVLHWSSRPAVTKADWAGNRRVSERVTEQETEQVTERVTEKSHFHSCILLWAVI